MNIEPILLTSGAYRDLNEPVILASGQLGIFYVNGEKLCMDDTRFIDEYAASPVLMGQRAIELGHEHPEFGAIVKELADMAEECFDQHDGPKAISGGQRRDWVFSFPVAEELKLPHVALYKDGKQQYTDTSGKILPVPANLQVVHVADILTQGSSAYDSNKTPPTGWIPRLRSQRIEVWNYLTAVTRNQGGEQRLADIGVKTRSLASIDRSFLETHSSQPAIATAYFDDPEQWSRDYLANNDLKPLAVFFDPERGKLDKSQKFMDRYADHLRAVDRFDEFNTIIQERYRQSIDQIVEVTK